MLKSVGTSIRLLWRKKFNVLDFSLFWNSGTFKDICFKEDAWSWWEILFPSQPVSYIAVAWFMINVMTFLRFVCACDVSRDGAVPALRYCPAVWRGLPLRGQTWLLQPHPQGSCQVCRVHEEVKKRKTEEKNHLFAFFKEISFKKTCRKCYLK